ncbi:uncharacterized protein B0I36DRAFT_355062 [Microdochium trichocladiopsis]|uniref:BZIP domain-containing protein n=1 Tax=Microdochium trichocladiopsis TaxID=1682393 RepID=A0A9P8XT21_9PEZI|nr:uncharacterized protein B0I36DRAFT_355062 [Microdochium trichocladiopsis]KAH7016230.1 hypothetical protein B0I36DRAFT_355062 [Microdochium trichocladiopsis]
MAASSNSSNAGTASPRCGRPLTTSYADLMKPDEDWRNLPDAAERRKIQNRLAQRAYRRNMRDRTKEVEKLKKQLQELQGTLGQNGNTTPPPDHDSPPGSNMASGHNTPPMSTAAPYMATWSQLTGHENLSGLGLTGVDASFDPSFFGSDVMTGMVTPPSSSAGSRPRATTASSVLQNTIHGARHLRSNSSGAMMGSNCSSPMPNQWSAPTSERRDSLTIGSMSSTSSPMLAVAGQETFGLSCSPEDVSFMQARPSFSLDESLGQVSYPPPPDVGAQAAWQGMDPRTISQPNFTHDVPMAELPDMTPNMPETSAPLLHFAIASGSRDTLRILLQRHDVDIQARDQVGYTPLQRAVACGRTDMVQTLLDHGATIDGDHVLHDAFLPSNSDTQS